MRKATSWPRRVVGAVGCAFVVIVVLTWIGSSPSWIGVLAAVAVVAAAFWFASDLSDEVATAVWTVPSSAPSERPTLDGRLAALRRLSDSAAEPPPDGSATRPAAVELQDILRRATEQRLGRSAHRPQLPADLAEYLGADPAPPLPTAQLDRLLTRIEEL